MKVKFATAVNCIDGRVQAPVAQFIRKNYGVDFIDMITAPGPDKILSEYKNMREIQSMKKKVLFSYHNRDSKLIFIASHNGCLGNPCSNRMHLKQLKEAVKNVRKWRQEAKVFGVWVDEDRKVALID